jgi:hypothetical protein
MTRSLGRRLTQRWQVSIPRLDVTLAEVAAALANRLASCEVIEECSGQSEGEVDVKVGIERGNDGIELRITRENHGRAAAQVRRVLREAPELRVPPQLTTAADGTKIRIPEDSLVSLLGVYAGQFGSYTTLLWQVPALGLTAQSFLLTIALQAGNGRLARILVCALSAVIAVASSALMHNQRGRAINHGELLRRLSEQLALTDLLGGSLEINDAVPKKTTAQNIWAVDRVIYHGWKWCMYLFIIADGFIIAGALWPPLFR